MAAQQDKRVVLRYNSAFFKRPSETFMNPPKAIALLGPTASGKTGLALEIAAHLPVEIISLDSALVYRGMDIGTAKPDAAERAACPHHLIDIISPLEAYSAAEFVADCVRLAGEIHARGRLPLIVGGTMMYFHALTQGLNALPQADAATRAALQAEKTAHGLPHLYARLQAIDPATAARLKPADSQRIERALEVWQLTGRPLSAHFAEHMPHTPPLDLYTLALIPADRALLHAQIAKRFHAMLEQGFLDEVQQLQAASPRFMPTCPRCAASATARLGIIWQARTIMPASPKKALPPPASSPSASSPGCAKCRRRTASTLMPAVVGFRRPSIQANGILCLSENLFTFQPRIQF